MAVVAIDREQTLTGVVVSPQAGVQAVSPPTDRAAFEGYHADHETHLELRQVRYLNNIVAQDCCV